MPVSNHGLTVPGALLKPDHHRIPPVSPGAAPQKSFVRPGARRAAAGEELAHRELGQVRHLLAPVSAYAGALRGTAELQNIIREFYSLWPLLKQKFCQYLVLGLIPRSSQYSRCSAYVSVMHLQKN